MTNSITFSQNRSQFTTSLKIGICLLLSWTIIGVYLTSMSSILFSMDGIRTNWYYLSLNYFSSVWIWVLLTPVIYKLYRRIFNSNFRNYNAILFSLILGVAIALIHVISSFYLGISLRKWLGIIEIDFWDSIIAEIPQFIKFVSNSFGTYVLLISLFAANDHFGFVKKFALNMHKIRTKIPTDYKDKSGVSRNYRPSLKLDKGGSYNIHEKFIVKSEGKIRFLPPHEIRFIESKGNYVLIRLHREQVIVRTTLKAINRQLSSLQFFRINRSVIVNLDHIREMEPWFNGEYVIRMNEEYHFKTGRAYRSQLRLLLRVNIPK